MKSSFIAEALLDHLVDGRVRYEHRYPRLGVGGKSEPVNPVEALKVSAGREVAVDVDGVVAFVMKADALAERGGIREKHHARWVCAEPQDLGLAVFRAAMNQRGREGERACHEVCSGSE